MMTYLPNDELDRAATRRNASHTHIVAGLVLVALGLAFSLGLAPIGYLGDVGSTFSALGHIGPWMIPGFALFFIGVGLLVADRFGGDALLTWGCGVAGFGFGVSLGLWPIGFIAGVEREFDVTVHIGPWMLGGLIPLFVGLALVLADLILRPQRASRTSSLPDTWARSVADVSPLAATSGEG